MSSWNCCRQQRWFESCHPRKWIWLWSWGKNFERKEKSSFEDWEMVEGKKDRFENKERSRIKLFITCNRSIHHSISKKTFNYRRYPITKYNPQIQQPTWYRFLDKDLESKDLTSIFLSYKHHFLIIRFPLHPYESKQHIKMP